MGGRRQRSIACAVLLGGGALWPVAAGATPVSGERQTVSIEYTTSEPGAPTGFEYAASFRDPAGGDPPPLRRLVFRGPEGGSIDTAVTTRCDASDDELKQRGEAACPPESRIGSGTARVKPLLLPAVDYMATLFNADHDQRELLTGDPPAPNVVVHGFIRGDIIDSPIPTCLNGGYAPEDCPDDQAALVANTLSVPPLVVDGRSYMTTPPICPRSLAWQTEATFHYGDGVVETLVTEQPCARPTLTVVPRRPGRRAAQRARRLRVAVEVAGAPRVEGVRAALRRVRREGGVSRRILGRAQRAGVPVSGRRILSLGLRRRGLRPGRYEVAVRARGADRVTRRFRLRR